MKKKSEKRKKGSKKNEESGRERDDCAQTSFQKLKTSAAPDFISYNRMLAHLWWTACRVCCRHPL